MAASPIIRVRVTAEMLSEIEAAAKSEGKTPSDIVRESVAKTLKLRGLTQIAEPGRPMKVEKSPKKRKTVTQ